MTVARLPTDCDFSETSLDWAAQMIGAKIADLHVHASRAVAMEARRLQGLHGFELTIVPHHMMINNFAWSVSFAGNSAWSPGCP